MFSGRNNKYDAYEMRCVTTVAMSSGGYWDPSVFTQWTPNSSVVSAGAVLQHIHDQVGNSTTYTVSVAGTSITGSFSEAGNTIGATSKLVFYGLRRYMRRDPSSTARLWRVTWTSVEWYVNGVLKGSWGASTLDGTMVAVPCSIPIFGVPPIIYADPPTSGRCSGATVTGGWRVMIGGTWYTRPVALTKGDIPPGTCDCTATPTIVTGGDTYAMSAGADNTNPTGYSWVMALPNNAKGVVRMNPDDYAAVIDRWGMPKVVRHSSQSCKRAIPFGFPPYGYDSTEDLTIYPGLPVMRATVTNAPHVIEDPLGYITYAPYYETGKRVCDGSGSAPYTPITNLIERYYPVVTDPYAQVHPNLQHANPMITYLNTIACPNWSYFLYEPQESATLPDAWPIDGAATTPQEYWIDERSQFIDSTVLPSGERLQIRNDIISEPLGQGGMAPTLESDWYGQRTSWWGISVFEVDPTPIATSKSTDAGSGAAWSSPDGSATIAVGTDVVITPLASPCIVDLDLGRWDCTPNQYPHAAKKIGVSWSNLHVTSIDVDLVGIDGTEALLTHNAQGTFDRVGGTETKYAQSLAQDMGVGYLSDVGTDILGSGISSATLADPERAYAFQLLPGWGASKLRFKISATGVVTLHHPTFYGISQATSKVFSENAHFADIISDHGPGLRWGQWSFYAAGAWQNPPVVADAVGMPTALDWYAGRRHAFEGRDAEDGLDAEIATIFESGIEYTQRKHLAADPIDGLPLTHSFLVQGATKWVPIIVSSYREMPPVAWWPQFARDADFASNTATLDQKVYSYITTRRNLICPNLGGIYSPTGDLWRDGYSTTEVPGWTRSWHTHQVDGSEGLTFKIRVGRDYAHVRPWHSAFAILPPIAGGEIHCFPRPGGALYALVGTDTQLEVRRYTPAGESAWTAVSGNVISCSGAWDPSGRMIALYVLDEASPKARLIVSNGFEDTWSSPMDIGSATRCAIAIHEKTGIVVVATWDTDGWYCRRALRFDAAFTSPNLIVTAAEGGGGLEFDPGADRHLRFVYTDGTTVRTYTSPDFGETWEPA